jgi:septum formation protein
MLLDKLKDYNIILASASPRRKELLKGMGIDFTIELSDDVEEVYPADLPLREVSEYLAKLKSKAFPRPLAKNELLITADTVVICNEKLVGKPVDSHDAARILQCLSGNRHEVHTGVCLRTHDSECVFTAKSTVTFRPVSSQEISYYINTCKPFDKAGAYGVQEWIGYIGIEHIEGSYYNVMGLPTQRLYVELNNFLS